MTGQAISRLKTSVVGIGITDHGKREPRRVMGTGFFISEDGYVMSALHVFKACMEEQEKVKNKSSTDIVAFSLDPKKSLLDFNTIPLGQIIQVNLDEQDASYIGPSDLDLGIGIPAAKRKQTNYLKVKHKSKKLPLGSRVALCGYPQGLQSLNLTNKATGARVSPLVQFGVISGYMLYDDAPQPYALQTDILGTAGSSES